MRITGELLHVGERTHVWRVFQGPEAPGHGRPRQTMLQRLVQVEGVAQNWPTECDCPARLRTLGG